MDVTSNNAATTAPRAAPAPRTDVTLSVNGAVERLTVDNRSSLLDVLRERLGLTGAKKGCDHGQCGACTVLLGGRRVNACLVLAVTVDGAEVVTVEGLADGTEPHPLQDAFIAWDAFQCGYCTPGQLCSAAGMLAEAAAGAPSAVTPDPPPDADGAGRSAPDAAGHPALDATGNPALDAAEIRERMSGNLCRCGAYPNILAAIREVAESGGARASGAGAGGAGADAPARAGGAG